MAKSDNSNIDFLLLRALKRLRSDRDVVPIVVGGLLATA